MLKLCYANSLWWLVFLLIQRNIEAGPTIRREIREVYPDIESSENEVCIVGDVVYGLMEPVPADQPCLKCRCRPPGVQCETIRCVKKPGCKAIHKPNNCCPEYQCECQYNGKMYANGERLETSPGGECKVCYCRGGEIQCAQVSCYIRTDCEAKAVPGQCCPKYDHCPPKEPSFNQTTKEILNLVPISDLLKNTTDESTNALTTDKPKILEHTKITIQEIIPEIKEIPITEPPTILDNKENDVQDSDTEQSEITEIIHPPSVLRIGDKLLYLKKGELIPTTYESTPNSVITIIGAEGLQQGYEDSGEAHETELKTSDSTHILSLVRRKPTTTTTELSATTPTTTSSPTTTAVISDVENSTIFVDNETITEIYEARILPEVLPIRSNKTVPQNVTNSEWLKSDDETPTSPSSSSSSLNETEYYDTTTQSVSVESLENESVESSDEATTPKNSEAIILQDASIETTKQQDEVSDLLKTTPSIIDHEIEILQNSTEITTTAEDTETIDLELVTKKPERQEIPATTALEGDEVTSTETTTVLAINDEIAKLKIDVIDEVTKQKIGETPSSITSDEASKEKINETTTVSNDETTKVNEAVISNTNDESANETITPIKSDETTPTTTNIKQIEEAAVSQTTSNINDETLNATTTLRSNIESTTLKIDETTEVVTETESKRVLKRAPSADDEADEVFKQLDAEINAELTERTLTKEEEEAEAKKVFSELLEEMSTPKSTENSKPKSKENEMLQRVSNALARLTLRGGKNSLDTSILSILGDFFSSQNKYYGRGE